MGLSALSSDTRAIAVDGRRHADSLAARPDGVPMYKCVSIRHDAADAMFGAIEYAWEHHDSSTLARLYETKPRVLAAIMNYRGGNRYKLPHWRTK